MGGAVAEVLEYVELLAELSQFEIVFCAHIEKSGKSVLTGLPSKNDEIKSKGLESIQGEAFSGLKLADGTKHLTKLKF